jgi:hypothetical protein
MQNLLATLEPLCHQDRMRLMVESGKNPDVTVLNALEAGNVYERRLALTSCFSSRDSARVLRGLQDASGFVRGLAISIAPIVLSVTDVLSVLDLLPAKMRLVLLYAFERQKKVTPIADAYLERLVLAGNTREATAIIRFASAVAVQKHGAVMELAAPFEWARLARQHPSIVADWLEAEASALLEANPRLVWRVNAVLPHLALFSAARAMQLLRVVRRTTVLGRLHLQPLLAICPQEVAVLLLETDEAMNLELSAVAHRISLEQLLGLQTQHPRSQYFPSLQRNLGGFSRLFVCRYPAFIAPNIAGTRSKTSSRASCIIGIAFATCAVCQLAGLGRSPDLTRDKHQTPKTRVPNCGGAQPNSGGAV